MRALQCLVVAVVLRVVHAALVELRGLDSRVARELDRLPDGMGYAVQASVNGPRLFVQWRDGLLRRCGKLSRPDCGVVIKTMPLAFRLFTGQMGLAQAYAQHALEITGDVGDVMRLARLINLVEAYLFPPLITRRILTDVPALECSPLRVYARIACGFAACRYKMFSSPDTPA